MEYVALTVSCFALIMAFIALLQSSGSRGREPDIVPELHLHHQTSAVERLAELRAQEEIERDYTVQEYWEIGGERVEEPTEEMLRSPGLHRVSHWVPKKAAELEDTDATP